MNEFINLLNQNAGILTLVFSFIVAVSTVFYAILTCGLAHETKRMRKIHTEPLIDVTYNPKESHFGIIDLRIKNIGLGPAYNISFEIKPLNSQPSCMELVDKLKKKNFFITGINYLSPEQNLTTFLASTYEDFENKMKVKIQIKVTYKSIDKKTYKNNYIIDLSELNGLERVGVPDLHKIAQSVERLQKDIGRVISSSRVQANIRMLDRAAQDAQHKRFLEKRKNEDESIQST